MSSYAVLASLSELLLIWKYFQLFSHATCRCLFPCIELGILFLVGLFGLECARFEAIAQMLCSPLSVGRMHRMALCGCSGDEGKGILLERTP